MFIFFSNSLFQAALLLHLQLSKFILRYEAPWSYYGAAHAGDGGLVRVNDVICQCMSTFGQSVSDLSIKSRFLVDSYLENGRVHNVSPEFYLENVGYTCVLLDEEKQNVWLLGDPIGTNPIWYLFNQSSIDKDPTFLVTTDYIMASKLGFGDLNILQPNYMLSANLVTNQVHRYPINLNKKQSYYMIQNIQYDSLEMYSHQLLASLMTNIVEMQDKFLNIYIEVDSNTPTAAFIDCAYDSLGISRNHVIHQLPSVPPEGSNTLFSKITSNSSLSASDRKILFEGYNSFSNLKYLGPDDYLVDSLISIGTDHRAYLRAFAHHFFAEMTGINATIGNPYQNSQFLTRFWNFYDSELEGLLVLLLDDLRAQGTCPEKVVKNEEIRASHSVFQQSAGPNHIGKLWKLGASRASNTHKLILVVVTSGYQDLFVNFICSLQASNIASLENIIVITFTDDIVAVAKRYGLGSYVPTSTIDATITTFGTLSYQSLMLTRTKLVLDLMYLGFSCIVIDIDTVWLQDPMPLLDSMHRQYEYDVAFTDDGGEVCGCFLDLSNSDYAVLFWKTLSKQHEDLLISMENNPKFDFTESEQKILTRLIYGKGYDSVAVTRDATMPQSRSNFFVTLQLQQDLFPSGLAYFNLFSTIGLRGSAVNSTSPYIVHNNFVVGKDVKISRFKKYKLWYSDNQYQCSAGTDPWNMLSSLTPLYDVQIPSIALLQPVHNSKDKKISSVMVVTHVNGLPEEVACIKTWFDQDPPSFLLSSYLGIYSFIHRTAPDQANVDSKSVTATLCNTSIWRANANELIGISSDFTFNNSIFSVDYGGHSSYLYAAQERLLKFRRNNIYSNGPLPQFEVDSAGSVSNAANKMQMEYSIVILAHKRPSSLARLLESLLAADYSSQRGAAGNWNVSMTIFIDPNRSVADGPLIDQVFAVATNFTWPYGKKQVIRRDKNIGLANSWFHAWYPQRENEAAFIFEDDLVVSPYFFQFGTDAVTKYYADDPLQRQRQRQLLEAFKASLSQNNFNTSLTDTDLFKEFMNTTAGLPLIYGICLQRQHLDPFHSPLEKVNIINGNKPFLYSLVGSWGPLMLPIMWQAFREWWIYTSPRAHQFYTHITPGRSIIRDFHNKNKGIWTPWMVRFAYETGSKCLYSNLPQNLSLIVNYREGNGENYVHTMGPDSALLDHNSTMLYDLKSLLKLPPIETLSLWQFDLNMRRLGSFGYRKPFILSVDTATDHAPESLAVVSNVRQSIEWAVSVRHSVGTDVTTEHALLIIDAIEEQLLLLSSSTSNITIMHIGFDAFVPLIDDLISAYNIIEPTFSQIISSADISACKWLPIGLLHTNCINFIGTESMDVLMFDLDSVTMYDIFTELSPTVQVILVLSSNCISAPNDVALPFSNSTFTLVGDICSEQYADAGLSIYHRVTPDRIDSWRSTRLSVSRRVKEYTLSGVSDTFMHRIFM